MLILMVLCLFNAVVHNILHWYILILLLKSYLQIIAVVQKKGDIIMVENISYSKELNCYVIVFKKFLDKKDFFKKPCESSSIGIFEAQCSKTICTQMLAYYWNNN